LNRSGHKSRVNCGCCEGWRATAVVEDDMIICLTDKATDAHGAAP
jgi:hypothetical protein